MGPTNESYESEGRLKALLRVFPVPVPRHNYVQTEGPILSYLWCRLKVHGTNESAWTQEGKYIVCSCQSLILGLDQHNKVQVLSNSSARQMAVK